jgi:hypothetical protein
MQSKTEQMGILAARSLLYSFVSALFSAPASEKFQLLQTSEFQDSVRTSAKYLEDHPQIKAGNLETVAQTHGNNGSDLFPFEVRRQKGSPISMMERE